MWAVPFLPLRTSRQLDEGLEAGAAASFPLILMHGLIGAGALLGEHWQALAVHGGLALLALLAAYVMLKSPSRWLAWVILGWLLFELALARPLLGYDGGRTILNVIGLPLAILGIRVAHRRAALLQASRAP